MTAPTTTQEPTTTPAKSAEAEVIKVVEDTIKGYLAEPKSGLKTTELWLSVLALVNSAVLARWHTDLHLTASEAVIAAVGNGVIAAVYTAARSWLKAKHIVNLPPK